MYRWCTLGGGCALRDTTSHTPQGDEHAQGGGFSQEEEPDWDPDQDQQVLEARHALGLIDLYSDEIAPPPPVRLVQP